MKIYKVCARIGDKLVSATTHRFGLRSAECEYKIGIPTVPHPDCGPLAGFDTFMKAEIFVLANDDLVDLVIFEAEATISKFNNMWIYGDILHAKYCPPGTLLCGSITLLKEIDGSLQGMP